VYEYRLIRKHSPTLNTQVAIAERKGDFQPLDDCIVLLPHAEKEKGMSFWFRKNQKINMRPFCSDFRDGPAIEPELEAFFFGGMLPPFHRLSRAGNRHALGKAAKGRFVHRVGEPVGIGERALGTDAGILEGVRRQMKTF